MTNERRKELVAEIKDELMTKYRSLPREVKFGAIYYQAAVKSGLAAYVQSSDQTVERECLTLML